MGWKSSLIIIENKGGFNDEEAILKAIGKSSFEFDRELTLDECIFSNDESINIGYYNGNIIISDDYQLTTKSLEQGYGLKLSGGEKGLVNLFPESEIISVACYSAMNYHAYSLINQGVKKRLKFCTAEDFREYGDRMEEESEVYSASYQRDGQNFWKTENTEISEDQLMEDFTFGIAKRRLGVLIDHPDGRELLEKIKFKKYKNSKRELTFGSIPKWVYYVVFAIAFILFKMLR